MSDYIFLGQVVFFTLLTTLHILHICSCIITGWFSINFCNIVLWMRTKFHLAKTNIFLYSPLCMYIRHRFLHYKWLIFYPILVMKKRTKFHSLRSSGFWVILLTNEQTNQIRELYINSSGSRRQIWRRSSLCVITPCYFAYQALVGKWK